MNEAPGTSEAVRLTRLLAELTRLLLRFSGEGAEGVGRAVRGVAHRFDARAEVTVLADGATLTVDGAGPEPPVTQTVAAAPDVSRLDRAVAVKRLGAELVHQDLSLDEAERRVRAIESEPSPYPAWAKPLGIVLFATGFAPAVQPTWYELWTTVLLSALVAGLCVLADHHDRLASVLPLAASVLVSLVTLGLLGPSPDRGGPVLIMLPALFFLLPGDYLSAAVTELVAGGITPGAARLVYALVLLLQLYVGIMIGVAATGTPTSDLLDSAATSDMSRWVIAGSWLVFTAGLALAFSVPMRVMPWVLLLVYVTLGVQAGATRLLGEVAGTFLAAVVLAALADLWSRPSHRPPRLLLVLGGFFTLTVGSLGLRALTSFVGSQPLHGFHDLLDFVTIVTTIAVGLLAGAALVPARRTTPER